jgi:3-deoxy-D-manno-octulosonic-acid transferase
VHNPSELAAAVALYFEQPELRRAAGAAAYSLVADNRGALVRTLELMDRELRGGRARLAARTQADAAVGKRL